MIAFVSDLHLSPATPHIARLFHDFLGGPARRAEALYLLGDIFEYWLGDDDRDDPFVAAVVADLAACSASGVAISLIHGNRDFLLGPEFARATGIRLLPDPYVLSLPTWQFVLTHGDHLCIDDAPYVEFRNRVRTAAWQTAFLAKPLAERQAIVRGLRQDSEAAKLDKTARQAYVMDVNAAATDDFLRRHGYATMIHGHTHRPATHDHIVDGIHCQRWVLADWREGVDGATGEYLAWDGEQLQRHPLRTATEPLVQE